MFEMTSLMEGARVLINSIGKANFAYIMCDKSNLKGVVL